MPVPLTPGSTMMWQKALKDGWGNSMVSARIKKFNPVHARLRNFCIACAKRGDKVKLDHSAGKARIKGVSYDVDVWKCPFCRRVVKDYFVIGGDSF